ncbi:MAG: hypothetical protein EHM40_06310 [Chloroflexi bacterium]|nr:MAG: hypothetical protein EHM40_06310 [Chloroflexota bacterium]
MNRNYLPQILSVFVILMAIIACVLPGQTIQPTPGISSNAIATAVAGTAQAAAQQTAAAQPAGMTGTAIEQVQDGTTQYTDYDAGFEISFPAGWLAVRPNSEEFNASLANASAVNSMLHEQMTADLAGYEADYDRLYAYILRPDIKKNVMLGFSKLVWDSETARPLDSVTMGDLVRDLESPDGIPGFHADTAQLHEDSAVKMIEVGGRWTMSDGEGGTIPFYITIIFFKPTANSGVRATFTFIQDYQAQIATDVKSVMESIRIIEP